MQRSRAALGLALLAGALSAQEADSVRTPTDSAVLRARQMVQGGRVADARRLLDSLLTVTTPDSAPYPEILYWRGMSAPTAAAAERDYRRLLIEAPLSSRAEDALLQLAQLEQARGDRRGASDHLQRFLLSYPNHPARPRVSVQLVRLLFDQGPQQLARACEVLQMARAEVPASSIELRNQLDANVPRCAYVEAQMPAPPPTVVDSAAKADSAVTDSTTRSAEAAATRTGSAAPSRPDSTRPQGRAAPPVAPAPAPTRSLDSTAAFYSVQLAAYDSEESANRMVQQLLARGIAARVDGTGAPYRVRVGKYATRADAAKAQADLRTKGHSGFITLVAPQPR